MVFISFIKKTNKNLIIIKRLVNPTKCEVIDKSNIVKSFTQAVR